MFLLLMVASVCRGAPMVLTGSDDGTAKALT